MKKFKANIKIMGVLLAFLIIFSGCGSSGSVMTSAGLKDKNAKNQDNEKYLQSSLAGDQQEDIKTVNNTSDDENSSENANEADSSSTSSSEGDSSSQSTSDIKPDDKLIAITFDDGPSKHTDGLLDILDQYNAKATFFMVGINIPGWEDTLVKMKDRGHQLGNHTYNHSNLTKLSDSDISYHISSTNDLIEEITGVRPTVVRPPYGAKNENVQNVAAANDSSIILWDIDPRDWEHRDAAYVSSHLLENAADGSILLLHDTYASSIEAAEIVLKELTAQGYKFVTVDQLLQRFGDPIENGKVYSQRYPKKPETPVESQVSSEITETSSPSN